MAITMPRKIELAQKHAKKFASKSESTPVLGGVHYAADGSIIVTDRHRLLRIRNAHSYTTAFTSHAKTGAPIDGVYPDTTKLFPQTYEAEIALITGHQRTNVKDAMDRVKVAMDVAKLYADKANKAVLALAGGFATLTVSSGESGVSYATGIEADVSGIDVRVTFNAEFLYDALAVFKDAGSGRVNIRFTSAVSPIVITDEANEIDVIVLPYRTPAVGSGV